jgi:hypothetical protein
MGRLEERKEQQHQGTSLSFLRHMDPRLLGSRRRSDFDIQYTMLC